MNLLLGLKHTFVLRAAPYLVGFYSGLYHFSSNLPQTILEKAKQNNVCCPVHLPWYHKIKSSLWLQFLSEFRIVLVLENAKRSVVALKSSMSSFLTAGSPGFKQRNLKKIALSYAWVHLLITRGRLLTNPQNDRLPVELLAQLIEHCTSTAEVIGLGPAQASIYFAGYIFTVA